MSILKLYFKLFFTFLLFDNFIKYKKVLLFLIKNHNLLVYFYNINVRGHQQLKVASFQLQMIAPLYIRQIKR